MVAVFYDVDFSPTLTKAETEEVNKEWRLISGTHPLRPKARAVL